MSLLESRVSELESLNSNLLNTLTETEKKLNDLKNLPELIKELSANEKTYKEHLQDLNTKYAEVKKEKRGLEKEVRKLRKQCEGAE